MSDRLDVTTIASLGDNSPIRIHHHHGDPGYTLWLGDHLSIVATVQGLYRLRKAISDALPRPMGGDAA